MAEPLASGSWGVVTPHLDLVSVITPFFNAARFLEEAIESVLSQTHESWELLLVNDGSTDDGGRTARSYAALHPERIRYLEHEAGRNRGTSASRNLGLREARGPIIAFLDADDVWLPRRLERQMPILARQPEAAMVCGETVYWHGWTRRVEDGRRDRVMRHGVATGRLVRPPLQLVRFLRGQAAVPCTCSVLVRRDAAERVGGFENGFTGLYDDQVFFTKLCLDLPVFLSDDCEALYRIHPDSLCGAVAHTEREIEARLEFLEWAEGYLRQSGRDHPDLHQALAKELWLLRPTPDLLRWGKKWLLRGEERLLPAEVRRRLWSRVKLSESKARARRRPSARH